MNTESYNDFHSAMDDEYDLVAEWDDAEKEAKLPIRPAVPVRSAGLHLPSDPVEIRRIMDIVQKTNREETDRLAGDSVYRKSKFPSSLSTAYDLRDGDDERDRIEPKYRKVPVSTGKISFVPLVPPDPPFPVNTKVRITALWHAAFDRVGTVVSDGERLARVRLDLAEYDDLRRKGVEYVYLFPHECEIINKS